MGFSIKHILYLVLGVAALLLAWPHGFDWMGNGGNILNFYSFFRDAYDGGPAAAFLTIDLLIVWIAFMIWVVIDAREIGLGAKWGWGFVLFSCLGVSVAFPIYLVVRERHLGKTRRTA